jgi:hypothetical protein
MAKTFKWDSYSKESKRKPYVLEGVPSWHPMAPENGGNGELVLPVPSGPAFLQAEKATSTTESLRLMCGYVDEDNPGQWPMVERLIYGGDPEDDAADRPGTALDMGQMLDLVQDITRHFGVGEEARPPAGGRR